MAIIQTSRNCKRCSRRTLHAKHVFSNTAGVLFSLLTLGLFIPIWLLIGILEAFKPWRCQQCGGGRLL